MIGIFDSGIGGLSVWKEIRKALPGQSFLYYSDSAHCPYGEKSREYITGRAREITRFLIGKGADIIVIACNTATAAAIADLRSEFPQIRFIGTEPAIKPAIQLTRSGIIGVLATASTLQAEKYLRTRQQAYGKVSVAEHVGKGFVELVEKGDTSSAEAEETVRSSVQPLLDRGADVIVLGCTHYPFLSGMIGKVAGPDVRIIEPAPAIARHLIDVMHEEGIPETDDRLSSCGGTSLYCSGDATMLRNFFSSLNGRDDISGTGNGTQPHPSSRTPEGR